MRYLLVIAPTSCEERELLRSEPARAALVLPVVGTILSLGGASLCVHTTEPQVQELLAARVEHLLCEPPADPETFLSHKDRTARALQAFLDTGVLDAAESVIVVDYRNIHLGAATLRRVQEMLEADPETCCASFGQVRDHPVQYRAPYRLHGLEAFVFHEDAEAGRPLLEPLGLAADCRVSRPFFFDWRALGHWDERRRWHVCRLGLECSAVNLLPWGGDVRDLDQGDVILFRESPASARRLFPAKAPRREEEAARPAYTQETPLPMGLAYDPASGVVRWSVHAGCGGSGLLLLWPLLRGALGARLAQPFPAGPGTRSGALSCGRGLDGMLACLFADALHGPYDYLLPLDGRDLWAIDPVSGRAQHPVTKRFFNNRQEFPALYELDGAVLGGRVRALLAAGQEGPAWGMIRLEPREALKVQDRLGLALETGVRLQPGGPAGGRETGGSGGEVSLERTSAFLDFPEFSCALAPEAGLPGPDLEATAAALGVARLSLARLIWKYKQLQWLTQWSPGPETRDPALHWVLFTRAEEYKTGVSFRLFEAEIRARRLLQAKEQRDAGAASGPVRLPGPRFAGKPLGLTSDGRARAFVCVKQTDRPGGLWAKDLASGDVKGFGQAGADYRSLWFDRGTQALYALSLDSGARPHFRLDCFDASLRFLRSADLPAVLQGRPRLDKLSGNGASLFLIDYDCRFLFELDKETLALREIHGFFGNDLVQNYVVRGEELFATGFYESLVTVRSLRDGAASHFQSWRTLLPTLLDYDATAQRIYVVSRADFPASYAPREHWLNALGRDGACLWSLPLGSLFVSALHVLEATGAVLLLDFEGNLLLHQAAGTRAESPD